MMTSIYPIDWKLHLLIRTKCLSLFLIIAIASFIKVCFGVMFTLSLHLKMSGTLRQRCVQNCDLRFFQRPRELGKKCDGGHHYH